MPSSTLGRCDGIRPGGKSAMATRLYAGAPLLRIIDALERARWAAEPHERGRRRVVAALAAMVNDRTGHGVATVAQVADRAAYTPEWTARMLAWAEELGEITWERGGVIAGRPVPSRFRVVKAALLGYLDAARLAHAERLAARRDATHARITARQATGRALTGPQRARRGRFRRPVHVEVSSTLPPLQGEDIPPSPVDLPPERRFPPDFRAIARQAGHLGRTQVGGRSIGATP